MYPEIIESTQQIERPVVHHQQIMATLNDIWVEFNSLHLQEIESLDRRNELKRKMNAIYAARIIIEQSVDMQHQLSTLLKIRDNGNG